MAVVAASEVHNGVPDLEMNEGTDSSGQSEPSKAVCTPGKDNETDGKFNPVSSQNWVFFLHFVVTGLIMGGVGSTLTGVFFGYLNVPAYILVTYGSIIEMPATLAFLFGILSDSRPIWGLRRRPYMAFGWALCSVALISLGIKPMPAAYYCVGHDGEYLMGQAPCNVHAPETGDSITAILAVGLLGIVIANAAANGLLVEYTQQEPEEKRGSMVALTSMATYLGGFLAKGIVGIGMNGKQYNGTWERSLSFSQICWILAVPAFAMACSLLLGGLREDRVKPEARGSFRSYVKSARHLLAKKVVFFLVLYKAGTVAIGGIHTTAVTNVVFTWAQQKQLQIMMFDMVGALASVLFIWLVKTYFLNYDWRKVLAASGVTITALDAVPIFLTIFNVIRNPYFLLGESLIRNFPSAIRNVVSSLIMAELADHGNEALVFGLLSSVSCLFDPIAHALGNQIFSQFEPALSDRNNYLLDTSSFRRTVAWSFCLSYCFGLAAMGFLVFLPAQKQQAQQRKQEWCSRQAYFYATVALVAGAIIYSAVIFILTLNPSTACLHLVGGPGCA